MATAASSGRIEGGLSSALRDEVLRAIQEQGLAPEAVADRLGLVPTALRALLDRPVWPLRTAVILADGLDLPLEMTVTRDLFMGKRDGRSFYFFPEHSNEVSRIADELVPV